MHGGSFLACTQPGGPRPAGAPQPEVSRPSTPLPPVLQPQAAALSGDMETHCPTSPVPVSCLSWAPGVPIGRYGFRGAPERVSDQRAHSQPPPPAENRPPQGDATQAWSAPPHPGSGGGCSQSQHHRQAPKALRSAVPRGVTPTPTLDLPAPPPLPASPGRANEGLGFVPYSQGLDTRCPLSLRSRMETESKPQAQRTGAGWRLPRARRPCPSLAAESQAKRTRPRTATAKAAAGGRGPERLLADSQRLLPTEKMSSDPQRPGGPSPRRGALLPTLKLPRRRASVLGQCAPAGGARRSKSLLPPGPRPWPRTPSGHRPACVSQVLWDSVDFQGEPGR